MGARDRTDSERTRRGLALIARYSQLWDDRRFNDWIELFTPDADFDWRGRRAHGRDAIQRLIGAGNDARPDGPGMHVMTNSIPTVTDAGVRVISDFAFVGRQDGRYETLFLGRTYDHIAIDEEHEFFTFRGVRFVGETPPETWEA